MLEPHRLKAPSDGAYSPIEIFFRGFSTGQALSFPALNGGAYHAPGQYQQFFIFYKPSKWLDEEIDIRLESCLHIGCRAPDLDAVDELILV